MGRYRCWKQVLILIFHFIFLFISILTKVKQSQRLAKFNFNFNPTLQENLLISDMTRILVYIFCFKAENNDNRMSYCTALPSPSPKVQINNATTLCFIIPDADVWPLSKVVFQWLRAQTVLAHPAWFSLLRGNWIVQGCNSIGLEECWAAGEYGEGFSQQQLNREMMREIAGRRGVLVKCE